MRHLRLAIVILIAALLQGCDYVLPPEMWEDPQVVGIRQEQGPRSAQGELRPIHDDLVMVAKQQMLQILKKVNSLYSVWGGEALTLRYLPTGQLSQADPWGHSYCLRSITQDPTESGTIMAGFVLVSAGPDGQFETHDDIRWEGDLLPLEESKMK